MTQKNTKALSKWLKTSKMESGHHLATAVLQSNFKFIFLLEGIPKDTSDSKATTDLYNVTVKNKNA